jgi:hypothetical protein
VHVSPEQQDAVWSQGLPGWPHSQRPFVQAPLQQLDAAVQVLRTLPQHVPLRQAPP